MISRTDRAVGGRGAEPARRAKRALASILAALAVCAAPAADTVSEGHRDRDVGEGIIELDPFAVIAHPSGAEERPASVWVARADASFTTPLRAGDLLNEVPGVHVDQPGGAGGRATMYLRGGEVNHVVMFFGGVPLNDPSNSRGGAVDLSIIDPGVVTEAAVVRGPPSVRYGPETLAGVVHLRGDDAGRTGAHLTLEGGGDDLRRGSLIWRGELAPNLAAGLGAAATAEGSMRSGTRVQRRFLHGSISTAGAVDFRSSIWHARHKADGFPDDSGGLRLATVRDLEHRDNTQTGVAVSIGGELENSNWDVSVDAGRFDAVVTSPGVAPGLRDPAGLPGSIDDTSLERWRLGGMYQRAMGSWNVTTGLDVQSEDGRAEGMLDFGVFTLPTDFDFERTRVGGFAEVDGLMARDTTVTGGLRVDDYDDGFTRTTARIGVLHTTSNALQWRANAGTGFKPPSFYALAHPLVGNPDLRPERATSFDAGVRGGFANDRGIWDLTVFDARFRDGIDFDPGPPPRLVNRTEIRTRGVELGARFRPTEQWLVQAAVSNSTARTEPDGERLRYRPRWRGTIKVAWLPTDDLRFTGAVEYVGRLPDSSIPTGDVVLDDWTRVDLGASWQVVASGEVFLSVDNVLDADYEEAVGFPSPGRRFRLGLRTSF